VRQGKTGSFSRRVALVREALALMSETHLALRDGRGHQAANLSHNRPAPPFVRALAALGDKPRLKVA
jgi:hypothetical protein